MEFIEINENKLSVISEMSSTYMTSHLGVPRPSCFSYMSWIKDHFECDCKECGETLCQEVGVDYYHDKESYEEVIG